MEWEVRNILDSQLSGHLKKLHYLVSWEGYRPKHNFWELVANLYYAPNAMKEFHQRHPNAAGPTSCSVNRGTTCKTNIRTLRPGRNSWIR